MGGDTLELLRRHALWFEPVIDGFAPLFESLGGTDLVLIGEASHGTHEFYRARAELRKALIERGGGSAGDLPDLLMMAPSTRRAAQPVSIRVRDGVIAADLRRAGDESGLVIFAHGSGSSRFSTRNRAVAEFLEQQGMSTLLLDLLTRDEERVDARTAQYRFDIDLLAERVIDAIDWTAHADELPSLPIGLFGASTGAAAALMASAERPKQVHAVVSRGGRPDLAGLALSRVQAPTLLVVGGDDAPVIEMNRDAMGQMTADVVLEIVPGASHLFEEPGTLERVMDLAAGWFNRFLR